MTGLLVVCSAPALVSARRHGRTGVAGRFLIAAAAFGLFFGASAAASDKLVDRCSASGNMACFDVGYQGLLILVVLGFLIVSVATAVRLGRP